MATILVVEDEHDIATFLGAYFRASGYALVHVDPTTVEQVLAAVAEHRPACVLLDMHLRGLAGLDVHQRLRDDPATAAVPVILVTGDVDGTAEDDAVAAGAAGFAAKPFRLEALVDLVAECVARGGDRDR